LKSFGLALLIVVSGIMALTIAASLYRQHALARPNGRALEWKRGVVQQFDYGLHPGSYDMKVEWTGPNGLRKILRPIGDRVAKLYVDDQDRLHVLADGHWLWTSPESEPLPMTKPER
jgi:hypothetical protein